MKKEELLKTCDAYERQQNNWRFYQAAYEGAEALVRWGVLRQFEADIDNFNARKNAAFGFNYTKRVTNIITDFLREVPFEETFVGLEGNALWNLFVEDCDLYGTNWENFWGRKRKWASVFGHCGILVDKPTGEHENRKEELAAGVYPYLAYYSPLNILQWEYERDSITNRPVLTYLKLLENGNMVRIWRRSGWEVWEIPDESDKDPVIIDVGINPLEKQIIPFVWFGNGQDDYGFGESISDVVDIARIDASLVRDASNADEVLTNAAFPMLAVPKEEIVEGGESNPIEVGPLRVLEFTPGSPGDKPFWMESKVKDAIDAILKMWEKKGDEIYGIANLGIIREMSKSAGVRSGESLKESFRFLNTALAEKVDSEIEARLLCVKYWLMWQGMDNDISITHEKKFNTEKLMVTLDDAIKAKEIVMSPIFKAEIDKLIVRRTLPGLPGETSAAIDAFIDGEISETIETIIDEETV